jgi:hypothetical protein
MPSRRQPTAADRRFRKLPTLSDHGPIERWQHAGRLLEPTERAGVLAARVIEENMLDILLERGWISARQQEAALLLRLDFHRAGLAARVGGSYSPTRQDFSLFSGWDERTEREELAYQRWRGALAVLPVAQRNLIIATACQEEMPHLLQAPALREACDALANFYRIPLSEAVRP